MQNGVGNEEIIAEHVRYVIRGTTFPAGHIVEPGHVGYDIQGDTWIGPFEPTATPMAKVNELAGLLNRAGMSAHPARRCARRSVDQADFQCLDESRRRAHAAASRRGDASFSRPAQLFDDADCGGQWPWRQRWASNCTEIRAQLVQKGANAPGKHKASMLQDVLAKRVRRKWIS